MFKKILMVCVGNICRSITAERMLREKAKGLTVDSAGLGALVNHKADEMASEVAAERGLSLDGHSARQLTTQMCKKYDLILVMEKKHLEGVTKMAPEVRGKTMLLGKWLGDKEIADPYKRSKEVFEITYDMIEESIDGWCKYIG